MLTITFLSGATNIQKHTMKQQIGQETQHTQASKTKWKIKQTATKQAQVTTQHNI